MKQIGCMQMGDLHALQFQPGGVVPALIAERVVPHRQHKGRRHAA
jgi:hypothetical protein